MKKVLKVMAIPLALSAFLVACNDEKSDAPNGNTEVAKVGKVSIKHSELQDYLLDVYGAQGLNGLISQKLVELEAKEYKITVSKDEINDEYKKIEEYYGGSEGFSSFLKSAGKTKEQLMQDLERSLLVEKTAKKYLNFKEEDVKKYFEQNKEKYAIPEEVEASHILVADESKAKELIEELNKSKDVKATFEELAKKHSTDSTAQSGGKLGYFSKGQMVQAFEDVAFNLEVGTYAKEPVKSEYGYHIIYVTDHKQGGETKYEDVKETVSDEYFTQLMNSSYQTWMTELQQKYKVENKLIGE